MDKSVRICPSHECEADFPKYEVIGSIKASQAGQPQLSTAVRCKSCGCVWQQPEGQEKVILGHWDDTLGTYGWKPYA